MLSGNSSIIASYALYTTCGQIIEINPWISQNMSLVASYDHSRAFITSVVVEEVRAKPKID